MNKEQVMMLEEDLVVKSIKLKEYSMHITTLMLKYEKQMKIHKEETKELNELLQVWCIVTSRVLRIN